MLIMQHYLILFTSYLLRNKNCRTHQRNFEVISVIFSDIILLDRSRQEKASCKRPFYV